MPRLVVLLWVLAGGGRIGLRRSGAPSSAGCATVSDPDPIDTAGDGVTGDATGRRHGFMHGRVP